MRIHGHLFKYVSVNLSMQIFKGKRGKVYKILNFAVKFKNNKSYAIGAIKNEVKWLRRLNKYKIGPKLYYGNEVVMITSFIHGEKIIDFFKKSSLQGKEGVIREILRQSRLLDILKVDKLEMHHPKKHIFVKRGKKPKVVMIDFERCKYSQKPKNLAQVTQFLSHFVIINKGKLKHLLQEYKKSYKEETYEKIVDLFLIT